MQNRPRSLLPGLPAAAWRRVAFSTLVTTMGAWAISEAIALIMNETITGGLPWHAYLAALLMPLTLFTPMVFVMSVKQQELRLAYAHLHLLASTDALTSCLNRGAFTRQVTERLDQLKQSAPNPRDALLVVDADHFKTINDSYGHEHGDEALRLIAETIRTNVREGDLVGRIGGEEFGVFLSDATLEITSMVAERIRSAIDATRFAPTGKPHPLSVSVGGASFIKRMDFAQVFRIADERLYAAKNAGRNLVLIAPLDLVAA